ncbi:MAG TPA: prohibitin family protein, partial [Anaeromyxobacteraceae bacterium]|nr:prohibitin family protein [Anaeromyxobacteraceae bacterium]
MASNGEWTARKLAQWKAFSRRQAPYLILFLFLMAFLVTILFNKIVISIHPGELGVLWRRLGGGTQIDTVYHEGMYLIFPFNKMYIYDVRKHQFTDTINVLTVDGLTVTVRYSARYFLEEDTLPLLHQRVGPDYVSVVVRPEVRSVLWTVFGQYRPEEI